MSLLPNSLLLLWTTKPNPTSIHLWLEKVRVRKLCRCNLSTNGSYTAIDGNADVAFVGNWTNVEAWRHFYVNTLPCLARWDTIHESCNGKRMKWRRRSIVYTPRLSLWLLNDILNLPKFENLRQNNVDNEADYRSGLPLQIYMTGGLCRLFSIILFRTWWYILKILVVLQLISPATIMHVEVRDCMFFCLAKVTYPAFDATVVGVLGDWWVISSSSSRITALGLSNFSSLQFLFHFYKCLWVGTAMYSIWASSQNKRIYGRNGIPLWCALKSPVVLASHSIIRTALSPHTDVNSVAFDRPG